MSRGWGLESLKCPFCPCEFLSEADFASHLDAFGRRGHGLKFKKVHESLEDDYSRLHGGADDIVWALARIVRSGA